MPLLLTQLTAGSVSRSELQANFDAIEAASDDHEERLGADATAPLQLPIFTTTERGALTGVVAGAVIFNVTSLKINVYNGTAWREVTDSAV